MVEYSGSDEYVPFSPLTLTQIVVRLNGAALDARVEVKVDFFEDIKLKDILKQACKEMKNKDAYRSAKLYNRKGL